MSAEAGNQMTKPGSRSYPHRGRYSFQKWFERVRTSRRARRKLFNLLIMCAFVLLAFLLGFYYFGPSLSSGE